MLIFHYTCSKSDLRRAKMLIFHYTQSKKTFREGENVYISLYVQQQSPPASQQGCPFKRIFKNQKSTRFGAYPRRIPGAQPFLHRGGLRKPMAGQAPAHTPRRIPPGRLSNTGLESQAPEKDRLSCRRGKLAFYMTPAVQKHGGGEGESEEERRSGRVKMQIFHYTCSKSDLRRAKMLIFHYTQSKKTFREGENVDMSLYVQ